MKQTPPWAWRLASVAVAFLFIGAWALVSANEWISAVFLPSPAETLYSLRDGLIDGELVTFGLGTAERMLYGWALASLAGIGLGAFIGVFPKSRDWVHPTLEFVRPLPASAVMPVAIALFGHSSHMVLAVIGFGAVWPVLLATTHGFSAIEPRLEEVARVLKLSRVEFILKIGLPNALPDILAGMRLSLTVSLILAVVGEMLASQQGLGTAILLAARSFRAADLFAGIVLLSAIGFISNSILQQCEQRLIPWKR